MNVTVYLGANYGTDPALQTTVAELGQWIGKNGHTLVYDFPVAEISSTQIRSLMKEGKDCSQLLPPAVYRMILQKNLYRGQDHNEDRA